MGVGMLECDDDGGTSVAAGNVVNRRPVDMPISDEMGE
jgi:hypothetical protein